MANKLKGRFPRLLPQRVRKGIVAADLIDTALKAYNGGRLAEACRLYTSKMLAADGTVGMSLTGALTPAGLGKSCLIPLIEAGFVDWIISTAPISSRPALWSRHGAVRRLAVSQ
jgi:deoxyhypusine synthase